MSKYVYMIDFINEDYIEDIDQIECYNQKDVIEELKYLRDLNSKLTLSSKFIIINVKLVEDIDRDHEEDISYTLGQEVISILGYKPEYITTRNKGERL